MTDGKGELERPKNTSPSFESRVFDREWDQSINECTRVYTCTFTHHDVFASMNESNRRFDLIRRFVENWRVKESLIFSRNFCAETGARIILTLSEQHMLHFDAQKQLLLQNDVCAILTHQNEAVR
jgi:hypothetical protein